MEAAKRIKGLIPVVVIWKERGYYGTRNHFGGEMHDGSGSIWERETEMSSHRIIENVRVGVSRGIIDTDYNPSLIIEYKANRG